jgi:hypothetical protein
MEFRPIDKIHFWATAIGVLSYFAGLSWSGMMNDLLIPFIEGCQLHEALFAGKKHVGHAHDARTYRLCHSDLPDLAQQRRFDNRAHPVYRQSGNDAEAGEEQWIDRGPFLSVRWQRFCSPSLGWC